MYVLVPAYLTSTTMTRKDTICGNKTCFLRVVLFAEGLGSDPSNFRPSADATQWWNRRDALVRCVAAFLFGPNKTSCNNNTQSEKELVILFDQDWACMHMHMDYNNNNLKQVPTEQTIISLWKRASKQPGQRVAHHDFSCRMVIETMNEGTATSTSAPPSVNASKRDILQYLQSTCSLDFLRAHRLNSSSDVLLRKTNKNALIKVLRQWVDQQQPHYSQHSKNNNPPTLNNPEHDSSLAQILQRLLQPCSNEIQQVIAATLHESSDDELPCWDEDDDADAGTTNDSVSVSSSSSSTLMHLQVVLFLGAVRDMHSTEHEGLRRACAAAAEDQRQRIPLLKIRLGPVAEFTSKILTVVAFHHCHGRLGPANHRMLVAARPPNKPSAAAQSEMNGTPMLHFVCLVPISSSDISNQLEDRRNNLVLWAMVRCTVTSLWRSRLARGGQASHKNNHHNNSVPRNRLTFLFSDGALLTLQQEELVTSMAEQHQAAPSEYQILSALQQKVAACLVRPWMDNVAKGGKLLSAAVAPSSFDWKACSRATAKALIRIQDRDDKWRQRAQTSSPFVLNFERSSAKSTASSREDARGGKHLFYTPVDKRHSSSQTSEPSVESAITSSAIIVISISSHRSNDDDDDDDNSSSSTDSTLLVERQRRLVRELHKKKLPVVAGSPSLVDTTTGSSLSNCHCIDRAATIVTMLQHLCYQGRLFAVIQSCINNKSEVRGHRRLPKKRRKDEILQAMI